MALSDVLADASLELMKGAEWYGAGDPWNYPDENIEWVRNLARFLAVTAGAIQDERPLPSLPETSPGSTFVGLQMECEYWPLND
jgi:hypothetical protein